MRLCAASPICSLAIACSSLSVMRGVSGSEASREARGAECASRTTRTRSGGGCAGSRYTRGPASTSTSSGTGVHDRLKNICLIASRVQAVSRPPVLDARISASICSGTGLPTAAASWATRPSPPGPAATVRPSSVVRTARVTPRTTSFTLISTTPASKLSDACPTAVMTRGSCCSRPAALGRCAGSGCRQDASSARTGAGSAVGTTWRGGSTWGCCAEQLCGGHDHSAGALPVSSAHSTQPHAQTSEAWVLGARAGARSSSAV
mmetsp:Transcript_36614/g.92491  ORF Transcript_36614/g.92491 Transcript_36614/m.92491 type:complete len:263 (-) Transcript_36614:947-1735(-)